MTGSGRQRISWAVVVAAELVGAQVGLGYMINQAALLFQIRAPTDHVDAVDESDVPRRVHLREPRDEPRKVVARDDAISRGIRHQLAVVGVAHHAGVPVEGALAEVGAVDADRLEIR